MTDEQRGRFHVWRGRYFDEIDLSLMTPTETAAYKSAFQAGLKARDAEVQALREALTEVTEELASEILAMYGPIQAHPDTVRSFDRDMEPVYRARKLLAGGEQ